MRRDALIFERPAGLEATRPRDDVRLLVTTPEGHAHAAFADLPHILRQGDVLVVNESATIPASIALGPYVLNASTRFARELWLAEPRFDYATPGPVPVEPGQEVDGVRFVARYPGLERLWFVRGDLDRLMAERGKPIRYGYVTDELPLAAYQTVFSRVRGSAEMPSAAKPFTRTDLPIAKVVLHAGVSSIEVDAEDLADQPIPPEPFVVPQATADAVNDARRVIAVGTTVARALESAWDVSTNRVRAARGFSRQLITPDAPPRSFHGLITGLHDPVTTHLALLYALAGEDAIRSAYGEAARERYLWHEFGDSHLIITR